MSDTQNIVRVFEHGIVKDATKIVADDIADILLLEEQFESSSPEIGASLTDVEPLADYTVALKRREGSPFPSKPRVRTGALLASISEDAGDLFGIVFLGDSDETKVNYQQLTRPFFGVSSRALAKVEASLEAQGSRLVEQLSSVNLGTVRVELAG